MTNETPKYFPIMLRQSFDKKYLSTEEAIRHMRKLGVIALVLQVPWEMMLEHEDQARRNHSQSIALLASRGGLGVDEACAVLQDRPWQSMEFAGANAVLRTLVAAWIKAQNQKIEDDLKKALDEK